ncbi:MAG: hypothetical protein JW885_12645 [Deltaproteobacteria bacterium]|nr:hypothetical protein [Candidatus Zymogenaceae bacterium]
MTRPEEREGLNIAARLMAVSARTAPKSKGEDFVLTKILEGDDLEPLAVEMEKYGRETNRPNYDRDAANIRNTPVMLLIGIKNADPLGLNCGACGFDTCAELKQRTGPQFTGPHCAFRLMDMGIALGSAVKTAAMLNVDNRIMQRAGVLARRSGVVDWDYVMGIPLSATGKNIYFDR